MNEFLNVHIIEQGGYAVVTSYQVPRCIGKFLELSESNKYVQMFGMLEGAELTIYHKKIKMILVSN
jgi:hypothetical protein